MSIWLFEMFIRKYIAWLFLKLGEKNIIKKNNFTWNWLVIIVNIILCLVLQFFLIEHNVVYPESVFQSYTMGTFDASLLMGKGWRPLSALRKYDTTQWYFNSYFEFKHLL